MSTYSAPRLSPPHPLTPERDESVGPVVLRWTLTDGATRYRIQIALDAGFQDVVFEHDADAGVVALIVPPSVAAGEPVLHWRALPGDAQGWAGDAPVERVPTEPAGAGRGLLTPDDAEPYGPAVALLSATSLEALAEVLPGHQTAIEGALGEGHPEGVEAAEIVTIELGLLIAAGVVLALLAVLIVGLSL